MGDLNARFEKSRVNKSIQDSMKECDDYADSMGYNMDDARIGIEMGEKKTLKKKIVGMNAMATDLSSLVKGTELGEKLKKEEEERMALERERAKSMEHKVDKKIQDEWIKKSILMQETAFKDSESKEMKRKKNNVVGNAEGTKKAEGSPKKRGRPKKVKS